MNVNALVTVTTCAVGVYTILRSQVSDFLSIGSVIHAIVYSTHQMTIIDCADQGAAGVWGCVEFDLHTLVHPLETRRRRCSTQIVNLNGADTQNICADIEPHLFIGRSKDIHWTRQTDAWFMFALRAFGNSVAP